ncbi:hypothetical protein OAJ14_02205 [Polaribacter sp.]|nr:hypothetical protein [Polaribacter sp.]
MKKVEEKMACDTRDLSTNQLVEKVSIINRIIDKFRDFLENSE